jgi:branched-chain amino acid transport system substrate-binding protein
MSNFKISRRRFVGGAGGAAVGMAAMPFSTAFAVPKTIKIGLVGPQTGPLAVFSEQVPFTLGQLKKSLGGNITINGTAHPYEIVIKDSQSNPNRAAEVTQELILRDKVDVVTAFATPETVNPVSDQCELNGVPCITNDAPLEPYFFGRNGDPKKGFDWTFHFFWSGKSLVDSFVPHWQKLSQNKVMGVLWPNDGDGLAQARAFPPMFEQAGFKVVDPGRFDMPSSNYNAQISAFKAAGVEIVHAVVPPPEFTTFWNNAAQQNFHPKGAFAGKAMEFPAAVYPLGDRAAGLSVEVWWSRFHPYASGLTGQTAQELAAEYESSNNSQWSMPLGFRHSLFEVVFDALKRTQNLDSAASIRDAVRATDYKSIVGHINFNKGPFPGTASTPIVVGQWVKGKKWPWELAIVGNATAPEIPLSGEPAAIL